MASSTSNRDDDAIIIDDMDEVDSSGVAQNQDTAVIKGLVELLSDTLKHEKNDQKIYWENNIKSMDILTGKTILEALYMKFKNELDISVSVIVLKVLLSKWNGFDNNYTVSKSLLHKVMYDELYGHLSQNLDILKRIVFSKLSGTDKLQIEECISIDCPLKTLKTLFNSRFDIDEGTIYDMTYRDAIRQEFNYSPQNFTNWPHIAVKFSIEGFEILHENYNHYEFNVINIDNKAYKPKIEQPTNTELHYLPEACDKYVESQKINQYLFNLRTRIMKKTCTLPPAKKVEVITFLNEFTYDIRLADKEVGIGISYFANFCSYPYVRYMANTNHSNYPRGRLSRKEITVRLQQITYPAIKFSILKFKMLKDLDVLYQKDLMNSLTYYCTLCNKSFETTVFTELTSHVMNTHGSESGYVCVKCDRSFPVKILSGNRWTHVCMPKS